METQDDNLKVFLEDMRTMSHFVYRFANMRNLVRKHDQTITRKYGYFGKATKHEFDTPALIITQDGGQDDDDNIYLKYPITLPAIITFLEKNRKFYIEDYENAYLKFDKNHSEMEEFGIERMMKDLGKQDIKIIDYDDSYTDEQGGLVYAVILNLTAKRITVVFRGTLGFTDLLTDADFTLNTTELFKDGMVNVDGNTPGTHNGFTSYLFTPRNEAATRPYIARILACVNDLFAQHPPSEGYKLYVTGHSLGGGLSNLFGFRVAQLLHKKDPKVSNFPPRVKIMSFAAPCVGDEGYKLECKFLEEKGIYRHVRVANEGDVIPTNNIPRPFSYAFWGDTSLYRQVGVEMFLKKEGKMELGYCTTKSMWPNFSTKSLMNHGLDEHLERMRLKENEEVYEQTVEELYQNVAGFSNLK